MPQMTTTQRRQVVTWCLAHGKDVQATCEKFGVSQATLYRWLAQYAADPDKPLRAQSRRPHRTRQPSWTRDDLCRLSDLALCYPQATRRQLWTPLAQATKVRRSESTVGRMLRAIAQHCPVCRRKDHKHLRGPHRRRPTFTALRDALVQLPRMQAQGPRRTTEGMTALETWGLGQLRHAWDQASPEAQRQFRAYVVEQAEEFRAVQGPSTRTAENSQAIARLFQDQTPSTPATVDTLRRSPAHEV